MGWGPVQDLPAFCSSPIRQPCGASAWPPGRGLADTSPVSGNGSPARASPAFLNLAPPPHLRETPQSSISRPERTSSQASGGRSPGELDLEARNRTTKTGRPDASSGEEAVTSPAFR